jgi:hypothetical protein
MVNTRTMLSRRLLDPGFRYTPAVATDIGARFAAMRAADARAQRKQRDARQAVLDLEPCAAIHLLPTAVVLQLRPPAKRKAPARRTA